MSKAMQKSDDPQHAQGHEELPEYRSILLALDSSDHSNHGI